MDSEEKHMEISCVLEEKCAILGNILVSVNFLDSNFFCSILWQFLKSAVISQEKRQNLFEDNIFWMLNVFKSPSTVVFSASHLYGLVIHWVLSFHNVSVWCHNP